MQIVDLKHPERPFEITDCGLCLGNFDGVHRGHRALIRELQKQNGQRTSPLPLGAFLFTTPPSIILSAQPTPQINTTEEKLELLRDAGLRFAILYDFEELCHLSPEDFVYRILMETCHCRLAVCGFNYTYGAKGAGNAETLMQTFGSQPNRTLSVVPPVLDGTQPISSSVIRSMLERGHPEDAARLLGRPFFLTGKVTDGRHIGRVMGFPTANLSFAEGSLIPAHGVYVSTIHTGRRTYTGISNVGTRPTFDDGDTVNCETFLFDYKGDLYGKTLRVSLLRFLRAEKKFPSMEALEKQIVQDIARAKEYLW